MRAGNRRLYRALAAGAIAAVVAGIGAVRLAHWLPAQPAGRPAPLASPSLVLFVVISLGALAFVLCFGLVYAMGGVRPDTRPTTQGERS